ncbi:MAG: ChbG/HpnK family deacetylase [Bacteroidetes bacterium]|nr:ChbG/HpnK family deacetylase [Bacteroidota bacterium]MDA1120303.1 ChbG/HpnK family deacetylase [Bacteroidota bacterium]
MIKTILSFCTISGFLMTACAQRTQIIFRGDDMGFSHAANVACIDAYQKGVVRSVEVIVPGPWFEEAVKLLEQNPNLDVGVHLDLSSEWSNIKWRPITSAPSLVDENGYFYPKIRPDERYPNQALMDHKWDIMEVEAELRAQIEPALKRIPQVSHLTGHMGCMGINDQTMDLMIRLAEEYGLVIFPQNEGVENLPRWTGNEFSEQEKMSRLIDVLKNLKPGKYLTVTHPAYLTAETESIYHIGYENVGEDRDGETKVLISKDIKKLIDELDIDVIGYNDLLKD